MVQHIGKPIIDFTHYITGQTKNFTGREWVFQTINDWLANPDGSRYFLLTGEPGSGKTAIASRLAQFSQEVVPPPDSLSYLTPNFLSAIHFCSARDSRWINPQVFSESLAMQLPEHSPAYAKALAEKSGDRQVRIEVHQRIEQGQSIGVVINQLDVRAVAPEDAFNRIVREPLEALFRDGFHQQIVILVDALDEALSYSGNINIVSLLAHVNELPAGVRFILTCRQDARVENAFLGVEPFVLSEARYNQRNQEDICQYIQLRLSSDNELVARAAQIDSAYIAKLMEVVPRKAEGNFLYVRFLLDAMAKGKRALTELEGLPEGLDALYFESLERVVKLGKCDWSSEYAPLLGTLSIAQESLTLAQLQSFTSHTPKKFSIWQRLGDLQQFIEEMKSQEAHIVQETKYHLYHQSVIDFLHRQLLSNNKLRNSFYLPAEECHNSLIDGCERGGLPTIWEDVKNNPSEKGRREYARRHYATHLYLAQEWDRLFAVLDEDFYRREKIRYDSHSYSQDLHLGRLASTREGLALSEGILLLPRLWQYTLLHCSLVSQASHYSLEKFEALMLLQREQEAFGLAELLTDPCSRVDTMILIAHLLRADRYRIQESLQLLTRVRDIAASIEDNKTRARALGVLVHELAEMHFWEQAAEIANTIKDDEMKAKAMIDLGNALGQAQYWQQAKAILSEAEAIIHIIEDSEVRTELTAELGESFAYARQWERVKNVISTLNDNWLRANVLVEFGKALRHAQQDEQAEKVWIEAESMAQTIENSGDKAFMLGVLGCELAEALSRERAEVLWTEALLVAQNIEDSWDRSQTLIDLGDLLAQAQHLNRANIVLIEAEAAVRTIEECSEGHVGIDGAKVLGELGKAWAHAKQWERAEFIANDVGGTATDRALADLSGKFRIRAEILVELGKTMAQTGLEEQATRLWLEALPTGFIEWQEDRKWLLINLGKVLAQSYQFEQVEAIIQMIEDADDKEDVLVQLGMKLAQAHHWTQAKKVAYSIESIGKKQAVLAELGKVMAQAKLWEEAEEMLLTIENASYKVEVLSELICAFSQAQFWEKAEKKWNEVMLIFDSNENTDDKIWEMVELGKKLGQVNQWEQTSLIVTGMTALFSVIEDWGMAKIEREEVPTLAQQWEREQVARSIDERVANRTRILIELSKALVPLQHLKRAKAVLKEAEARIHTIGNAETRGHVLVELGEAYIQVQKLENAETAFSEVERIAETTSEDSSTRAEMLVELCKVLAQTGQLKRAEAAAFLMEEESIHKAKALYEIAEIMAESGKHEQLLHLVQKAWLQAEEITDAVELISLAANLISLRPEISISFCNTFTLVDTFLKGVTWAQSVKQNIM